MAWTSTSTHVPGGEVEAGEGAVLVQESCDGAGIGEHAGDVAARREAPQHGPVGVLGRRQRAPERGEVDEPVAVAGAGGWDLHDVGQALAPRQQVGVVLVGPHEHHPPLLRAQQLLLRRRPQPQRRRARHPDRLLQPLRRRRRARPAEQQRVLGARAHAPLDVARRFPRHPRRLAPHVAVLRVRVPCMHPCIDLASVMYLDMRLRVYDDRDACGAPIHLTDKLW